MDKNLNLYPEYIHDKFSINYEKVFENLPFQYLLLSPGLFILNVSKCYLNRVNIPRSELIGKDLFKAYSQNPSIPGADAALKIKATLEKILAYPSTQEPKKGESNLPITEMVGELTTQGFRLIHSPLLDADGNIEFIIQEVREVSNEAPVESNRINYQEKEDSGFPVTNHLHARIQNFLQDIPAGIGAFSGPDLICDYSNTYLQKYIFSGRVKPGISLFLAVPEMKDTPFAEALLTVFQTGQTIQGKEICFALARQDGGPSENFYFNYFIRARYNQKGEIDGVLLFIYDITGWVQVRINLEQSQKALQVKLEEMVTNNQKLKDYNHNLIQSETTFRQLNEKLKEEIVALNLALHTGQAETEQHRIHLETLFMQAPAPIVILSGPQFLFELVNPAYQAIFPDREIAGKPLLEALPEISGTPIVRILENVYATGETFVAQEMPVQLARKEGGLLEDIYFTFTYQARRNILGEVNGILVFAYEVTEQVRARQAAEANAKQLRLITDTLPVLIGYLDQDQKFNFANKAYEPWFNQPAETLIGKYIWEVIGENAYQSVKEKIEKALSGDRVTYEARMPYREDFIRYVRVSYIPDRKEGKVAGIYTLVSDVTEHVEARKALEKSEQQAKELAEELARANAGLLSANQQLTYTNIDLDNFIYTASHDLKSPILNIEGLLELMREYLSELQVNSAEVHQVLEMVEDSVDRFKHTVNTLTEITNLQQNHNDHSLVNLSEIVNEVILDLKPQIIEAGAELLLQVNTCESVSFSAKNLRSIIYNLLSNALKYRSPDRKPEIRISCSEEKTEWKLTVQDNGLGMNLDEDSHIFAMFKRLHDHVEGSGIGLYIVKRIVDNVKGRIEVQSEPGVGSTFTIFFNLNG